MFNVKFGPPGSVRTFVANFNLANVLFFFRSRCRRQSWQREKQAEDVIATRGFSDRVFFVCWTDLCVRSCVSSHVALLLMVTGIVPYALTCCLLCSRSSSCFPWIVRVCSLYLPVTLDL